jgi:cysteine-S-conjugate beta-lyase
VSSLFDDMTLDRLRARRSTKWAAYPPDVLPAFIAELDVPLAEPVAAALHAAIDDGDTGYAAPGELSEAFAEFAAARLGWRLDPRRAFLVPDVIVGIAEALRLFTAPGDGVVINSPVYPPFYAVVREVERSIVDVPLLHDAERGWEIDLAGLERAFAAGARAYVLCSPHNPLGRVFDAATLADIAALAARHGVLVLADEVHAPLTLPGAAFTPFAPIAEAAGTTAVALHSASKAWNLAGLKCALIVASDERVRETLRRMPLEARYRSGHLGVIASVAAFREGRAWLDALVAHLDRNRRLLAELLARELPAVGYAAPQASFLAWLDCRALGLGDDPAKAFLQRGRVALTSGRDYGPAGIGHARLNMGTSAALLEEAVTRMRRALE